jgi:hypothetical protein
VYLDLAVQAFRHVRILRQHRLHRGPVGELDQHRAARPSLAVVGEERPALDETVEISSLVQVPTTTRDQLARDRSDALGAVAEDQEPLTMIGGDEIPHRAPEHVPPPVFHDLAIDAGEVVGLLEREHVRCLHIRKVDHMHAPRVELARWVGRRTTGDHPAGVPVHERPVRFRELLQERLGPRCVSAVEEVRHLRPHAETPFSSCSPVSSNARSLPATRSFTVWDTTTSPGLAHEPTRAYRNGDLSHLRIDRFALTRALPFDFRRLHE